MIRSHCLPLLLSALAAVLAAAPSGVLELADKDVLRGQLRSLGGGRVVWFHEASATDMTFPAREVRRLLFSTEQSPDPEGDMLLLRDGSMICGELEAIDDAGATLRHTSGAVIKVPRARLTAARLAAGGADAMVLEGFPPLAQWRDPDGGQPAGDAWSLDRGVLRFDGSNSSGIQISPDLPQALDISFDLAWDPDPQRQTQPQLRLVLCGDGEGGRNQYVFSFNRSYLLANRIGSEDGKPAQRDLGRIEIGSYLAGRNSLRVRVVVNRPQRRLYVFLNGRPVSPVMQDSLGEAPEGNGISFVGSHGSPVRLRNLRLQTWRGMVGNSLAPDESAPAGRDVVKTIDGDVIPGRIVGLEKGAERKVRFTSTLTGDNSVLAVGDAFIRHLLFAAVEAPEEAAPGGGDWANLRLRDGSRFAARVRGGAEGRLEVEFSGIMLALPFEDILEIQPLREDEPPAPGEEPAFEDEIQDLLQEDLP
jgi:hypothetical protein